MNMVPFPMDIKGSLSNLKAIMFEKHLKFYSKPFQINRQQSIHKLIFCWEQW